MLSGQRLLAHQRQQATSCACHQASYDVAGHVAGMRWPLALWLFRLCLLVHFVTSLPLKIITTLACNRNIALLARC